MVKFERTIANEAKGLVKIVVRNSELENLHTGKTCLLCSGDNNFSHISQEEMKVLIKDIVNKMFTYLSLKDDRPDLYWSFIEFMFPYDWDEPEYSI